MSEFAALTPLADARAQLLDLVAPVERSETLPLESADGRVAAETVTAERAIPHYDRAAMDGFAVRSADLTAAGDRTPVALRIGDSAGPNAAVPVDTGVVVPEGADAVVPVEATRSDNGRPAEVAHSENDQSADGSPDAKGEILVVESVPPGANVGSVGEDVAVGDAVVDAGESIGPAHLGLLRGVGVESVTVYDRPAVALIPTGEELVAGDPAPGEIVETNSLVAGRYVDRWGGRVQRHEPVSDVPAEIEDALADSLDADVVVTLGGTSVGERDRVPAAVDALGELPIHGVGFRPGHPVGVGRIDGTPVITLPGYPVGCLVAAHLLLRPAVARAGHLPLAEPPTTAATLDRKIASDLGTRTYARVALDATADGEVPAATPIRAKGSGVLSSVSAADGWIVVGESVEGIPAGETVAVEHWDALATPRPAGGVEA